MAPADSERSSRTVIVGVEVHVYRGQNPSQRLQLRRSPATIGRDPGADVLLDSGHVSRIHARLFFDQTGMRLVDAGSTNGFSIQGRRLREAMVTADDVVALCDFELRFRPLYARSEPLPRDLPPGWADDVDADEAELPDPDTGLRRMPTPPPPQPVPLPRDPTIPVEAAPTTGPESEADEPDEDDDDELAPDLPPLLDTLRDEANALLYGEPHAAVDVEVIHTVGGVVYDVSLLAPTESAWWGGRPRGLEHLWLMPSGTRFPMVSHVRPGEYWVHVPDGGGWAMAHRGARAVDVHRSGPLLGCRAEYDDQIEITCGAFVHYARCVRRPPRAPRGRAGRTWRRASLWGAFGASFLLHASVLAIPAADLPPLRLAPGSKDRASFAVYIAPAAAAQPLAPEPEPVAPPPPPVEVSLAPVPALTPKPASRRPPRPEPKERPAEAPRPDPAVPVMPSVSVADFKVSSMVHHLPTVRLPANSSSTLRGGASLLRGDGKLPAGIVGKGGAARQTPQGRLPDEAIKRVVSQNAREIEQCYQRVADTGDSGRVEVEWIVDRLGTVTQVRIIYDEVHAELLKSCLRTAIKRWVFPPPKGGPALVSFPFVFANLRR